jgi:hypothetical protein
MKNQLYTLIFIIIVNFQSCLGQDSLDNIQKIHVAVQGLFVFPARVSILNSDSVVIVGKNITRVSPFGVSKFINGILTNGNPHFSVKLRRKQWHFNNDEVQFIRIQKILCFYFVRTNPKSQRPWINNPW